LTTVFAHVLASGNTHTSVGGASPPTGKMPKVEVRPSGETGQEWRRPDGLHDHCSRA